MASLTDVLDAAVEISTGGAEVVTSKWELIAVIVLGLAFLLVVLLLLLVSPTYGVVMLAAGLIAVYLLQRGDSLA